MWEDRGQGIVVTDFVSYEGGLPHQSGCVPLCCWDPFSGKKYRVAFFIWQTVNIHCWKQSTLKSGPLRQCAIC